MSWSNRFNCSSREEAVGIMADWLDSLMRDGIYDDRETVKAELVAFAAEWEIPFSWDLQESLFERIFGNSPWDDSNSGWYASGLC